MGNAFGMGDEARASRDYRVAPFAWRKVTCTVWLIDSPLEVVVGCNKK
jgi:hypothetical protein